MGKTVYSYGPVRKMTIEVINSGIDSLLYRNTFHLDMVYQKMLARLFVCETADLIDFIEDAVYSAAYSLLSGSVNDDFKFDMEVIESWCESDAS